MALEKYRAKRSFSLTPESDGETAPARALRGWPNEIKASTGRATKRSTSAKKAQSDANIVAGIAISHPDKLYFPDESITKVEIARYYERIAPLILPHIAGRPLSLVRCPDGWQRQCFYQKHADKSVNVAVDRIEVPEGKGKATYMGAASAKALVALVQWGVLEMHPWGSRRPYLERPDRLIFDFDPDEELPWKTLSAGVGLLRTLLGEIGLDGFLKTTGGKGLHVVVPIRPTLDWGQAKGFARAVADSLVHAFPDRFIASVSKSRRGGKIFIDYLRNAEGATAIAPFGVRARAGAPVSMPIAWEELKRDVRFDFFNVRNVERKLAQREDDPWRDFGTVKQTISKVQGKRVGFAL
jgi:bifunctional non-homologous end joining protein LigD